MAFGIHNISLSGCDKEGGLCGASDHVTKSRGETRRVSLLFPVASGRPGRKGSLHHVLSPRPLRLVQSLLPMPPPSPFPHAAAPCDPGASVGAWGLPVPPGASTSADGTRLRGWPVRSFPCSAQGGLVPTPAAATWGSHRGQRGASALQLEGREGLWCLRPVVRPGPFPHLGL